MIRRRPIRPVEPEPIPEAVNASAEQQPVSDCNGIAPDDPADPVASPNLADLEAEIARFCQLTDLEAELQVKDLAKRLGPQGVTVEFLRKQRTKWAKTLTTPPPDDTEEVEPWDDPVSSSEMLKALCEAIRKAVVTDNYTNHVVALWILHTYCYEPFHYTARLIVNSPEPECGKSQLQDLLAGTCLRGYKCDRITFSSYFRMMDRRKPSLILDEIDSYLQLGDLQSAMNGGYAWNGCHTASRKVGDDWVDTTFSTFGPLAMGGIKST